MTMNRTNATGKENVLRYLRLAFGMSREEVARRVGLMSEDIERFENGSRWLSIDKACRLADFFGVGCASLLNDRMDEVVGVLGAPIVQATNMNDDSDSYRRWLGAVGEAWVANQERAKLAGTPYKYAVNPNYAWERAAHFDVLSFTHDGKFVYIEVKTTEVDDDHPFIITAAELKFAERCLYEGKIYELHRVVYSSDPALCRETVYTARQLLEQFSRTPSAYRMNKEVA